MKDIKHSSILESLHLIKEAKSPPLVPPNEDNSTPNGKKHGDTIRVLKDINTGVIVNNLDKGTLWRCYVIPTDVLDTEGGTVIYYEKYGYKKLNAVTGLETKSRDSFSFTGYRLIEPDKLNSYFANGSLEVLTPGLPLTQGEITTDDLKDIVSNLDADKITGLTIKKLVGRASTTSNTLDIDFRGTKTDKSKMDILFKKILKALDTRGYKYRLVDNWNTVDQALPTKGYTDFIYISK